MSTLRRPTTHANSAPKPACRAVLNPRQHTTDSLRQAESRAVKPVKTRAILPAVPTIACQLKSLKQNGIPTEYHVLKGKAHYDVYRGECLDDISKLEIPWFDKYLQ